MMDKKRHRQVHDQNTHNLVGHYGRYIRPHTNTCEAHFCNAPRSHGQKCGHQADRHCATTVLAATINAVPASA